MNKLYSSKYNKYKEYFRKYGTQYYLKNREKLLIQAKEYRIKNREKILRDHHNYYLKHKELIRLGQKNHSQEWREKVLQHLGGKCKHCGFSDSRALQVDHVRGGGAKAYGQGKIRYYKQILNDKLETFQLLCANCNWIKKAENNEVSDYYAKLTPIP